MADLKDRPYPVSGEGRDPTAWIRANLGGIGLSGPKLPPTIEDVVRLVAHLADPDRITLFGSQARGDARSASDWDLFVDGVRDERGFLYASLDVAEHYISLRKIDLVDGRTASRELVEEVSREGVVLYERAK